MEEARLIASLFWCLAAAAIMFGGRYIILDSQTKAYCDCGHEYNEHNIVPEGRGYIASKEQSNGHCKLCGCWKYKKNDKDKRNTPPVKFFPHPFK